MGLCRYLPTPSDRMAILWSLLCFKDAVVLEYGPAGTTHFSMILYGNLGIEQHGRMFTTHMSEDDVVMGDVSRLENAILELDRNSNAKIIFVVASSISSVIGTDIKGVCLEMQERVNAKLVCFDQGGFKGDYSVGIMETYKLLAKEVAKKNVEKKEKTYNILGLSMGQYRAKSDLWELTQLMKEAFDFNLHTPLCTETTVEALENMGAAQINLVIRDEAIPAAKALQKKCGTDYILGSPYGYKGTLDWLKSIAEKLGLEINPQMHERLQTKAVETVQRGMRLKMNRDINPVTSIVGDYDRVVGIASFMQEYQFDIDAMLIDHTLMYIQNPDKRVISIAKEKDRIDILKACHNQMLFADDVSLQIADNTNTKMLVSSPFFDAPIANHIPIIGEKGADYMREFISKYFGAITMIRRG